MPEKSNSYYAKEYNLQNCDEEPIHYIQRCQNYGSLLCCDLNGKEWDFASENILKQLAVASPADFLHRTLGIDLSHYQDITSPKFVFNDKFDFACIVHKTDDKFIIEIEPNDESSLFSVSDEDYHEVILNLSNSPTEADYMSKVINEVYRITAYDHIMIYKFDDDYCGQVIAEKKKEDRISYLGLKFPSTDIPKQARDLYFKEKVRIIYDTNGEQTVIHKNPNHTNDKKLNLSNTAIRGVSPIHMEYLQNMDVGASFSVAIVKNDRIWGLIACHHSEPRFINFKTRSWLKFMSSLISMNVERLHVDNQRILTVEKKLAKSKIMEKVLATNDLMTGLLESETALIDLIPSDGVIIKSGSEIRGIGDLPTKESIDRLLEWISTAKSSEFGCETSEKSKDIMPPEIYDPRFAGLLILQLSQLSQDYIVWTRKEKSIDIVWAGNKNKNKSFSASKGRITPRKSFKRWKETVTDRSEAWLEEEKISALALKKELRANLYKKYNEVVQLNKELKEAYAQMETFSYSVSHDLKAPLRSIQGFAQILKDDYAENLDDNGLHLLNIITESTTKMNTFINEILKYSKLNQNNLEIFKIDINAMILKVWEMCTVHDERGGKLIFAGNIPTIYGDLNMINQVITNLLSNSLKYVGKGIIPLIKIWHKKEEGYTKIFLEDNGIGIQENQRIKVFDVFRRLVREEDYEGTGVGLSIVKKVIERHGGSISIENPERGKEGTLFCFTLPSNPDFVSLIKNRSI